MPRKKKWVDETKPKRPLSAYNFMARELRDDVKETLPDDAPATQIMTAIAAHWRGMSAAERAPYEKKAAAAKKKYDTAIAKWRSGPRPRRPRGSKKKDPTKPKRPLTAYLFFGQDKRAQAKADVGFDSLPGVQGARKVTQRLAQMWKQASNRERAPYVRAAEEAKEQYLQDKEAWKRKKKSDSGKKKRAADVKKSKAKKKRARSKSKKKKKTKSKRRI